MGRRSIRRRRPITNDLQRPPEDLTDVERAVDRVIARTGGQIRLGLPLGLGKPNRFVNALYRRIAADQTLSLTIFTALSLSRPTGSSDLERRFLEPFVDRVFGDYEELDYLVAQKRDALPPNVRVHQFFFVPGAMLGSQSAQRDYISLNYTHVVRDVDRLGLNVFAQLVASRGAGEQRRLSLSSNPEITLDLVAALEARRAAGEDVVIVAQVHSELPYLGNSAEVEPGFFDLVVDDPAGHATLFGTPQMPITLQDHFIGLHTSALVRDGGTLQIGIGALGDAVAHHTLLRHRDNPTWRAALDAGLLDGKGVDGKGVDGKGVDGKGVDGIDAIDIIDAIGGRDAFDIGLYGCSEMFTLGLLALIEARVIRRPVYPDIERQRAANAGEPVIGEGVVMHGGFFLGPRAFYARLRELDPAIARRVDMTRIAFVNQLYGDEHLKRLQRRDARFVNAAHTVTLLGAAVSDQLDDGRVISGVGGQYNFVSQAHALDDARSILMVRSWRERGGEAASNLVWSYGHATIPRHLRDVYVTEYGVADLRGRSDGECVAAMLAIADSRFQPALLAEAIAAGKVAADHAIAEAHRHNTPARLDAIADDIGRSTVFDPYPLGTDFTETEHALLAALGWLRDTLGHKQYLQLGRRALFDEGSPERFAAHLERMGLAEPDGIREHLYRRLLLTALEATAEQKVHNTDAD